MAVLLCRSDGKPYPAPPPLELRGLPRIVVDYEPIPDHSGYQGKLVKARTETQLACKDKSRDEQWKEAHDRHKVQLTQCGFHTPNNKPYKDVGTVELDDAKLILDGLGQSTQKKSPTHKHPKLVKLDIRHQLRPSFMVSPYQVKLHSKTPSQFPTELLTLDQKLSDGDTQLEHMRRGRRLYTMVEREKERKRLKEEQKLQSDQASLLHQWREAEVVSDLDDVVPDANPESDSNTVGTGEERQKKISAAIEVDYQPHNAERSSGVNVSTDEWTDAEATKRMVSQWHRKLCVMVWILEAMQLDSPLYAIPLAKCWNLDCKYVDEVGRRRIHERNQQLLRQWQQLYVEVKTERNIATPSKSFKSKVAALIAFRSPTIMLPKKSTSTVKDDDTTISSVKSRSMTRVEEEKMMKQKKLTSAQMDNLMTMLDEELNYTQKQSRTRINALLREAGQAKHEKRILKKWSSQNTPITLDLAKVQTQFSDAEEERRMIVHEQLTVMERDREEAIHQRLGSLQVSANLWSDLATMRKGVKIESSEMARRKLLMNYKWYQELELSLPEQVLCDRYCRQLLDSLKAIANYMYNIGAYKMTKKQLIQALATLSPWELQAPDVEAAIKYIMEHVVYVAEEDYALWLERHIAAYTYTHPRMELDKPGNTSSLRTASLSLSRIMNIGKKKSSTAAVS